MGFILNTAYWGKGYASEALEAILERIFETSNTKSDVGDSPSPNLILKADVDPRNERCLRLLTAFGFGEYGRKERTFETHLGWCDSVYLDLTQERWMKRKSTEDK
jgi:RimJ/RimL family protein N-acetyltransferase